MYTGLGLVLGSAFGAVGGVLIMTSLPIGIAIGTALGIVVGGILDVAKASGRQMDGSSS